MLSLFYATLSQSERSSPCSRDKARTVTSKHSHDVNKVEFGCTHHVSTMCNPVLFNGTCFDQIEPPRSAMERSGVIKVSQLLLGLLLPFVNQGIKTIHLQDDSPTQFLGQFTNRFCDKGQKKKKECFRQPNRPCQKLPDSNNFFLFSENKNSKIKKRSCFSSTRPGKEYLRISQLAYRRLYDQYMGMCSTDKMAASSGSGQQILKILQFAHSARTVHWHV